MMTSSSTNTPLSSFLTVILAIFVVNNNNVAAQVQGQVAPQVSGQSQSAAQTNCTPCDVPMSAEAGAKIMGNFNCSVWYDDATWDPSDSEMCKLNRIAGVAFCGCEVPRTIVGMTPCDLCDNGSIDIDLTRELPDVPGVTCEDILSVPQVDGQETCSLLQSKYSFWCGCPRAEPTCTLCPTGIFPPIPDKALPFDTNIFCGDIATEFLISTANQCRNLQSQIPIDLASYCECPGTVVPETCQLCPPGYSMNDYVVVESDLTCGDVNQMARFSLDSNVCDILEDVHEECCTDMGLYETMGLNNNPSSSGDPILFLSWQQGSALVVVTSLLGMMM